MSDFAWRSISDLTEGYRSRRWTVHEVVASTLDRIQATDSVVHAFTTVAADSALQAATAADRDHDEGRPRGPLHGVPVTVKDVIDRTGIETRAGSSALGWVPTVDAEAVRGLRRAGAIVMGKTSTPELAYGRNPIPTRNAWDGTSYPGGSSAGAAVSLAVGSAFGSIGTDSGGSIRVPAALNGVVGLKPTYGLVSRKGVVASTHSLDVVGPLARTADDCMALLEAMIAPMAQVPSPGDEHPTSGGSLHGIRVGVDPDYFFYPGVEEGVASAAGRAIKTFEELGARVVQIRIPGLDRTVAAGSVILAGEASDCHRDLLRDRRDLLQPGTRTLLTAGRSVTAGMYLGAQRVRRWIQRNVRESFEEHDLDFLAAPTVPVTTTHPDQWRTATNELGETPMEACLHHGMLANLTGQPSLSLPVGLAGGAWAGLQLIGRPFGDRVLLRIGQIYQSATNWSALHPAWLAD